jgi:prophage DNA circulation protein
MATEMEVEAAVAVTMGMAETVMEVAETVTEAAETVTEAAETVTEAAETVTEAAETVTEAAETVIIQTIVNLWNKSKKSLMSRSKTKQVRVSPKVPLNSQECINVYQCYMQRIYNRSRILAIKEPSIKKQSLK